MCLTQEKAVESTELLLSFMPVLNAVSRGWALTASDKAAVCERTACRFE